MQTDHSGAAAVTARIRFVSTVLIGCVMAIPAAAQTALPPIDVRRAPSGSDTSARPQVGASETASETAQTQQDAGSVQGYVASRSAAGTKTDTPIVEIPQSISVITRQLMNDQAVQSLNEALNYTPGITNTMFGYDPRYNAFRIRGFDATYTGVFRDGLRELNGNLSIFSVEPYGLDSIAVLRGPSSALYSQSSPGGLVDLQSKRPTATPLREVELQYGTDNRYQAAFDFSGPANADRTLLYRLTGLFRDSETSMPFVPDDRVYLAPAFTYRPDPNTSFTLLSEFQWKKYGGTAAYYNDANGITNLPIGDPYYNDSIQQQGRIGYAFEHRFSDTLKVKQNFRYAKIDVDYRYLAISAILGNTAYRYHERYGENVDSVALDNQAEIKFATGPVNHTVLAGVDYAFADYRRGWGSSWDPGATPTPPLNISTLNYGAGAIVDPAITKFSGLKQDQIGVYLQDQARVGDFIATLSGRHDWLSRDYYYRVPGQWLDGTRDDRQFSGRAGLTYMSPSGLAPYVSYSTSFSPMLITAPNGSGEPFAPTTAQGGEIGIKYQPHGVNALFSAAVFDITQQNIVVYSGVANNYEQIGEARSRGLELEATASLASGFSLQAAYTYLDGKITKGNAAEVGRMPSGIPHHQVSVWGNYQEKAGFFAGLGMGLGVRYVGTSYGDNANTFTNPAAAILDGKLSYDFGARHSALKGWEAQLNVRNLLGYQYTTCESGFCYRSEDRRVISSLRYRW